MTTREKGTGLGLAIVARIMEEHGGRLTLSDAPMEFHNGQGACVSLEFKMTPEDDPHTKIGMDRNNNDQDTERA
jgi:two-component system nitrogen regulation sensor histidine kinase NtrY